MKQYDVTGMSCAACSARVEKAVRGVPGVTSCSVNLLTNSMQVEGSVSGKAIISAVEAAGYGAALSAGDINLTDEQSPKLLRILLISLAFLLPEMYLSMGVAMWGWPAPELIRGTRLMWVIIAALTLTVMLLNCRFFINGCRGLLRLSPNMDTLVSMGSAASFIYSCVWLVICLVQDEAPVSAYIHNFFFDSAAMILVLITVGKLLEARSRGRTTDALKGLVSLAPGKAVLLINDTETEVEAASVNVGDIFIVKPGSAVPVDGTVISGSSSVDESMLTGESIPADKSEGAEVSTGTMNLSGYLVCRATAVGQDTALSRIIRLVSDSAASKAPIARIADKISGIFVPVVMGLAAVTFIIWLITGAEAGTALSHGISVLVVSCPCALGLATPVAIMVGNGVAARNNILFKTSEALEQTGKIAIAAIDKTGTITGGRPVVTDVIPAEGITEAELMGAAASLEALSEHPFARAITEYYKGDITAVTGFKALSGSGVSGIAGGHSILCGNRQLTGASGPLTEAADRLSAHGKTPLYVTSDGRLLGLIAVADTIRADSREAVRELKHMGIDIYMLTGDNEATASAIAAQAGIDHVIAGVKPGGKAKAIKELSARGPVLMIGDGINDAPALTAADIGMAIGTGTDIAIDAADVVLMKNSLRDAAAAICLSRYTIKNIHENLFWAFCYNIVGIPLAAGLWIPINGMYLTPMFGAAAMSISSFIVVTNALRLNLKHIYDSRHDRPLRSHRHGTITQDNNIISNTISEDQTMTKTISITGMMCPHCSGRVKGVLEALPEVASAEVSHETGKAIVELKAAVEDAALKEIIEKEGYKVTDIQ